jgi:hypothetical protein
MPMNKIELLSFLFFFVCFVSELDHIISSKIKPASQMNTARLGTSSRHLLSVCPSLCVGLPVCYGVATGYSCCLHTMTVTLTVSASISTSYSTGVVVLRRLTESQHLQLSQCPHQFCSAPVSPRLDKDGNTDGAYRDDLSKYCW